MSKQLVILIAPPGAGKGTQADLIAQRFDLIHIETGKIIQRRFAESDPDDPIIKREKKRQSKGDLLTPEVLYEWFIDEFRKRAEEGGIVLSGSPRTLYEVEKALSEFEKIFGRENIKIFELKMTENESVRRNSGRRMCQVNRHPIPDTPENKNLTICPLDSSPLIIRDDDKPEIIRDRYRIYLRDTIPVLDFFRKNNYPVVEINGEQPIEKVFAEICEYF